MARRRVRKLKRKLRQAQKGLFGGGGGLFPGQGSSPYMSTPGGNMGAPPDMGGYPGTIASENMGTPGGMVGGYPQEFGYGMEDYIGMGKSAFPNMGQWRPNKVKPQRPVDVLPGEPGGGGYGGPTPFAGGSKRWRKKMKRKMKRQFRGRSGQGQGGGFDVSNPVMSNMVMQSAGQMWPGVGNMMQSIPGAGGAFMGQMGFPNRNYPEFFRGFQGGGRDAGSPG